MENNQEIIYSIKFPCSEKTFEKRKEFRLSIIKEVKNWIEERNLENNIEIISIKKRHFFNVIFVNADRKGQIELAESFPFQELIEIMPYDDKKQTNQWSYIKKGNF